MAFKRRCLFFLEYRCFLLLEISVSLMGLLWNAACYFIFFILSIILSLYEKGPLGPLLAKTEPYMGIR